MRHCWLTAALLFSALARTAAAESMRDVGMLAERDAAGTWIPQTSDNDDPVTGLWASGPDDIYAVAGSQILHSTRRGRWTATDQDVTPRLGSVWGRGPHDVYAVGASGALLHLSANGKAWTQQHIPDTAAGVFAIAGAGPRDLYAVGGLGLILHSRGDGRWTAQASNTKDTLLTVWASGPHDVWAGSQSGNLLHSTGDGRWTIAKLRDDRRDDITCIWGAGPGDIYIAADRLYHSAADGTWTVVATPEGFAARVIAGSDGGRVYVAGDHGMLGVIDHGTWASLPTGTRASITAIAVAGDLVVIGGDTLVTN